MKHVLLFVTLIAAGIGFADIELVSPKKGEIVPVLTEPQRAFLNLSQEEKRAKFEDEHYRRKEMGLPVEIVDGVPLRLCRFPAIENVRDIGGVRGLNGRRVKQGMIYRSRRFNEKTRMDKNKKPVAVGEPFGTPEDRAYIVRRFGLKTDMDIRAGSLAYLLKALLGVDDEHLADDWAYTGFYNRSAGFCHAKFYDALPRELKKRYPAPTTRESAEAFARAAGITDAEIAKFRAIMLEGPSHI